MLFPPRLPRQGLCVLCPFVILFFHVLPLLFLPLSPFLLVLVIGPLLHCSMASSHSGSRRARATVPDKPSDRVGKCQSFYLICNIFMSNQFSGYMAKPCQNICELHVGGQSNIYVSWRGSVDGKICFLTCQVRVFRFYQGYFLFLPSSFLPPPPPAPQL